MARAATKPTAGGVRSDAGASAVLNLRAANSTALPESPVAPAWRPCGSDPGTVVRTRVAVTGSWLDWTARVARTILVGAQP